MAGAGWRVSYHGGHSGEFCQHAAGRLEEVIEAAIARGYASFGVSEHMPPERDEDRYSDEVAAGLAPAFMRERFRRYATVVFPELRRRHGQRIHLLLGMETEVLPEGRYPEVVRRWREELALEYVVGSVHHVVGIGFDMDPAEYRRAADRAGGLDGLYLAYYRAQREMIEGLRPEVVGHFDLIRKFAPQDHEPSAEVRREEERNLDVVAATGGVLDVNARALRAWPEPYPCRRLLAAARSRGVPVTFGDDTHGPADVGGGIARCREILLEVGFKAVTRLEVGPGGVVKVPVPL